jgi:hypothetical protein
MIVGIAGPAGSGKSLCAEHLHDKHGFRIVSLAAPIKRIVGELFGFTEYQLNGPSSARSEPHPTLKRPDGEPLTARYACQTLGTDWARQCCPEVWINALFSGISPGERVVCADVRFCNELEAFQARDAKLIRRRSRVPVKDTHPSEMEMLTVPDAAFDAVLPYDNNVDRVKSSLDALVWSWEVEGFLCR